jgi:hypothetical protein
MIVQDMITKIFFQITLKQPATRSKVISPAVNEPKNKNQQQKNDKQKALKKMYNVRKI